MTRASNLRTGGQILVDQLEIHGVDLAFGVPGESYLGLLDALYDSEIRYVICRQESGATMMAEAYGKLTGRPGIAMVTRGPGATNGAHGVHIARQDSTPMILFIGQVARGDALARGVPGDRLPRDVRHVRQMGARDRRSGAHPGSDQPGVPYRGLGPAGAGGDRAARGRADRGRGLRRRDAVIIPPRRTRRRPTWRACAGCSRGARRPFVVLGGGGWSAEACADIQAFAENFDLPVGVSFRRQDYFDNSHPNYAGHVGISVAPPLSERVRDADLLLLVGTRLGEASSRSYSLIDIPEPKQTLVHVHPGAEELGLTYAPDLPIQAGMKAFAAAARALEPVDTSAWREQTRAAHEQYLAALEPPPGPGEVQLGEIVRWLSDHLPDDAIVANGAGNYCIWVNGYYQYRRYRSQLGPTSGSMGYGTPAAIAAKLVHPERTVVCFAGDGCFLMTGQELATAAQYQLPVIWIVVNNGMYGTIRMHQERDYPSRVVGTELRNPDFAALARAYGGHGEVVERTADFPDAFRRAQAAGTLALIDLRVAPEAVTPRYSLTQIREGALAKA